MTLDRLHYARLFGVPSARALTGSALEAAPGAGTTGTLVEAYATETARDAAVRADARLAAIVFGDISVFGMPVAEIAVGPKIGQPGFEEVLATVADDLTDRFLNCPIAIVVGRVRYECDPRGQPIGTAPMYDAAGTEPELMATRAWIWMELGRRFARREKEKEKKNETSCGTGGN